MDVAEVKPGVETPIKKPRKPRTPKAKPPKKERVGLGLIRLVVPYGIDLQFTENQPPDEVAHDAAKVATWAEGVPALCALGKPIKLVRLYNVSLTLQSSIKVTAKLELDKEVPQSNQTV